MINIKDQDNYEELILKLSRATGLDLLHCLSNIGHENKLSSDSGLDLLTTFKVRTQKYGYIPKTKL